MRALLDTHVLLFAVYEPQRLGPKARQLLLNRDARLYWSVASSWEIAIKVALGKLRLDGPVREVLSEELLRGGYTLLPIDHAHVLAVADLPRLHGDPFDRLLVAQALHDGLPIVSGDGHLAGYGVEVIW